MADIIQLTRPAKTIPAKEYSLDITQFPDNLMFTVSGIQVSPAALSTIADELEKIARIIRADVVTGQV